MEAFDIKLICRLCAREDESCIQVFGENGIKHNISKKIRLCLPIITVAEDDKYPKQICLSCLKKLDTSFELYSGCMNAQNTIKRLLKKFTQIESAKDNLPVQTPLDRVQNDVSFIC
ncbi:hypothetical protein L798_01935 [Zootermopsis nevadensis]|uniref:ZAD domain-containing protein n=1 Tax=Zootermopsis nevadensis TaxID=136037 RepID=A0A067QHT2_ZOONE|nr:hypothetical protein L798_01935 [Zootermopsis nevadensis]